MVKVQGLGEGFAAASTSTPTNKSNYNQNMNFDTDNPSLTEEYTIKTTHNKAQVFLKKQIFNCLLL